jgi:4,5-dihydroxyphthalate decarboxylase
LRRRGQAALFQPAARLHLRARPLAWAAAIADEIAEGHGPDPFPYGIEESRPTLEAFCRYAHDQGVTHRRMTVADLFPREMRGTARV